MTRVVKFPTGSNLDEVLGIIKGTHVIRECFTHIDEDGKLTRKFDVTGIIEYCEQNKMKPVRVAMTEEGYRICKEQRGYEPHRLNNITPEIFMTKPVIWIELPDKTHLMIDGTHRFIKGWDNGMRTIPSYLVPESIWSQFLLPVEEGLTAEELLKKDSWFL